MSRRRLSKGKGLIIQQRPHLILIHQIRQLGQDLARSGLIERQVYATVPPRVDYSLTPLGGSLAEPLAVLGEWAYRHIDDVNRAIEAYDQKPHTEEFWQPK